MEGLSNDWSMEDLRKRREVGQGNSGVVYAGFIDEDLEVAVKQVIPTTETKIEQLKQEIGLGEVFGDLPGFVTFYTASEPDGIHLYEPVYIVMERAAGNMVDMAVKPSFRKVPKEDRVRLFVDLVRAVDQMSRMQIAHRDLQPHNVLILGDSRRPETWSAVLCDFDCACSVGGGLWPNLHPTVVGSPDYKAPEELSPQPAVTAASDRYALGLILYELMTRRRPVAQAPLDLEDLEAEDPELARIVASLTSAEPSQRATTKATLEQLEKYAAANEIPLEAAPDDETRVTLRERLLPMFRRQVTDVLDEEEESMDVASEEQVGEAATQGLRQPQAQAQEQEKAQAPPTEPKEIAALARSASAPLAGWTHPLEGLTQDWTKEDLRNRREVGEGNSGVVYAGFLDNGVEIAVKEVIPTTEAKVEQIKQEIGLAEVFGDLPGFVTLYTASDPDKIRKYDAVYTVMERAAGNMLDMVVKPPFRKVPKEDRVRLFVDVVRAVDRMSRMDIVHRDLTPQNVLILGDPRRPETWSAVLCDFEHATSVDGRLWPNLHPTVVGSPDYKAPEEMLPQRALTAASDRYALGLMLHELMTRRRPKALVPPDLEDLEAEDPELARIIAGLTAAEPSQRATTKATLAELEKYAAANAIPLEAAPDDETRVTLRERLFPMLRRHVADGASGEEAADD